MSGGSVYHYPLPALPDCPARFGWTVHHGAIGVVVEAAGVRHVLPFVLTDYDAQLTTLRIALASHAAAAPDDLRYHAVVVLAKADERVRAVVREVAPAWCAAVGL